MEPECYKIEVLHFINPYLIWVEVPNADCENADNFTFEQIGIFGLLPLEMSINPGEDILETKRSSEWLPGAAALMKNVLADAVGVSFYPVLIVNRNTIFDDNTHKYGEIVIRKPSGKYSLLSELLVKSGCAIYDENVFRTELDSGKIKTKLSHNKIKDIMKQLEKKCKKQLAKQTKVFQTAKSIETALTVKNLEAHNKRTKSIPDYEDVLQKKLEDLQRCKDVEQESVGRACKKKGESDSSSNLLKKRLKGHPSEKAKDVVNIFLKQRSADLKALQTPPKTEKSFDSEIQKDLKQTDHFDDDDENFTEHEKIYNSNNAFMKKRNTLKKIQNDIIEEQNNNRSTIDVHNEKLAEDPAVEVRAAVRSFEDDLPEEMLQKSYKRRAAKKQNKSRKLPDYDINRETRVTYGPPGMNPSVLPCKIVKKEEFFEIFELPEAREKNIAVKKEKEDMFAEVDSDVEIVNIKNVQVKRATPNDSQNIPTTVETPRKLIDHISKQETVSSSLSKRKLRFHKGNLSSKFDSSTASETTNKDSPTSVEEDNKPQKKGGVRKKITSENLDSDDDSDSEVIEKLNGVYEPFISPKKEENVVTHTQFKNHVNPFKNVDANVSKFVEKLVTPVLMVHSKTNKRFQPTYNLRDVPFNTHIQIVLKNLSFQQPMMLQSVTWSSILRGHSTFMIGPKRCGKTMGYLPAVCRLVSDQDSRIDSVGPMSIIVCATSVSVSEVEMYAKMFFANKEKVLAIYSGMNELDIATSLLNGCDLLICTPAILVRLLQADFGVDLRRLTTFVLDDCERLSAVFQIEIQYFCLKIKEMLKNRVQKEIPVQFILSSRVWCNFMESLAKKAPDTVICIGAFQECVLYSKVNTTASFVTKDNKTKAVLEFLKDIDTTKRSVIVCRKDEEVDMLEKALTEANYVVFACNSEMTVQDLYNLRGTWSDYQEPVIGPILLCLDGNLMHLNVTDAHYLVHYSLPNLFSAFCKRFSVLNDHYPSIFKETNEEVKIKILLEDSNIEQLPKILHFIKRCTTEVPTILDKICEEILVEKDQIKAKNLVPICDNLLTLGDCPDFWNCQERHAVVKDIDDPQDWVPTEGMIAFKIVHYHTAVLYSARLLSNTAKGQTNKYPQNYNMLAMKISMYYSRESNKKLHGVPEIGDICAVSTKQNFYVRAQVVKILSRYQNGKPNNVLVKLTDEEKLEITKDIYLYHLPEELKKPQTHVVQVRLAGLQPKDKDITFSELARDQLKNITDGEEDLYMRGQISLTIGNCVILESVEVCRDLSTLSKTVVLHDFKKILLEKHAMLNEDHLQKLKKHCIEGGMDVTVEKPLDEVVDPQATINLPRPQWAHLEKDDFNAILFASVEDPSTFFVRLVKYEEFCSVLVKDIQKYAAENSKTLTSVSEGDLVLAKLPDDDMFERARIDAILNDEKVKCFFVDQGDWREVTKKNLIPITEKIIAQLPFQAIECRLVGVKPPGKNWTEFATHWFANCFEDKSGEYKQIYAKYFTKEKSQYTGGHKYGVLLIDTNSEQDVIINDLMMKLNLAQKEKSEIDYLNELDFKFQIPKELSDIDDVDDSWERVSKSSRTSSIDKFEQPKISFNNLFHGKPIRSVPLIGSDESETSEDRWQINMAEDFMPLFKPAQEQKKKNFIPNLPALKGAGSRSSSEVSAQTPCKNQSSQDNASCESDSGSSVQKISSISDIQIVPSLNITELDSDDYTSPESSLSAVKCTEKENILKEVASSIVKEITSEIKATPANAIEPLRKPKVVWHQKKKNVIIKLLLVGVEKYDLIMEDNRLKFYAVANDTEYGFDLELYGIIDKANSTHSNKGQYIWICLTKLLVRNWLTLTKCGSIQKWIVYDADALDIDSTDDENDDEMSKEAIRGICKEQNNSESEDEEFLDDVNFGYSRRPTNTSAGRGRRGALPSPRAPPTPHDCSV